MLMQYYLLVFIQYIYLKNIEFVDMFLIFNNYQVLIQLQYIFIFESNLT